MPPLTISPDALCPCGSQNSFGRCCLARTELIVSARPQPREIPPEQHGQPSERDKLYQRWAEAYGHVSPIFSSTIAGRRFVGVGRRLHHGTFQTIAAFLDGYMGGVLERQWVKGEDAKPVEDRHPIMQWRHGWKTLADEIRAKHSGGPEITIPRTGDASSYFLLAWDIYSIDAHGSLQDELIRRLKNGREFQGVRHELFAMATLVRAGYTIEHHPKSKSVAKTECDALFHSGPNTGPRISVEAKSRYRHDVLGFKGGKPTPLAEMKARATWLLTDAFKKPAAYPLVIFLDLNMPPIPREQHASVIRDVSNSVEEARRRVGRGGKNDPEPYVALFLTNHPLHYRPADRAQSADSLHTAIFPRDPRLIARPPEQHLLAILAAVGKFGQVPARFADSPGDVPETD